MATNETTVFHRARGVTVLATAPIVGRRFVRQTATKVDGAAFQGGPFTATTQGIFGVAAHNAATGEAVTAYQEGEMGVEAAVIFAVDDPIYAAADGRATNVAGTLANSRPVGTALTTAAVAADVRIRLNLR